MEYYTIPNTPYAANDTDGAEFLYMTDAEIADLFLSLNLEVAQ